MLGLVLYLALFQIPEEARPLVDQAQKAIDEGHLDRAAGLLEEVLSADPSNRRVGMVLVDVRMRQGRGQEARRILDLLRSRHPGDPEVLTLAAAVAFRLGQPQEAKQLSTISLGRSEIQPQAHKILALSEYLLQNSEAFERHMRRAVELDPRDAEGRYHLGRFYYERKLIDRAVEELAQVIELDPEHYKAHFFLGWCRQVQGDLEAGRRSFRRSIEIIDARQVPYGWPFSDLGELLITQGHTEDGLGWLYRGTRNDPQLPYTHFRYAAALMRGESSPEIELHLKQAIQLDPAYAEAYYLLGRYYARTGESDRSKEAFSRFQELRNNPNVSPFGSRP